MKYICLAILITFSSCFAVNTTPQAGVSLERYMGRWYEQARFENWFEEGMEHVSTDYTKGGDGHINVRNYGINEHGQKEVATGQAFPAGNGVLDVSFVWPYWWFRAPYRILYVNHDYTAALVSGDGDKYLWLLTREQAPAPSTIKRLLREAERRGFDISRLRFTKQGAQD